MGIIAEVCLTISAGFLVAGMAAVTFVAVDALKHTRHRVVMDAVWVLVALLTLHWLALAAMVVWNGLYIGLDQMAIVLKAVAGSAFGIVSIGVAEQSSLRLHEHVEKFTGRQTARRPN